MFGMLLVKTMRLVISALESPESIIIIQIVNSFFFANLGIIVCLTDMLFL